MAGSTGVSGLSAQGSRTEEVGMPVQFPSPPVEGTVASSPAEGHLWLLTAPVAMPRVVVSGKDPFSERAMPTPTPACPSDHRASTPFCFRDKC